jgi:hypothetical protein
MSLDLYKDMTSSQAFSPCAHPLLLQITVAAHETLPQLDDNHLGMLRDCVQPSMPMSNLCGLLSNKGSRHEFSVTAMLSASLARFFDSFHVSRSHQISQLLLTHQYYLMKNEANSSLIGTDQSSKGSSNVKERNTKGKSASSTSASQQLSDATPADSNNSLDRSSPNAAILDLLLTFRYSETILLPIAFIEYSLKSNCQDKVPQSLADAIYLFKTMNLTAENRFWVPLLGVIISTKEISFRLYFVTETDGKQQVADIPFLKMIRSDHTDRAAFESHRLHRLVQVLSDWTVLFQQFLSRSASLPLPIETLLPVPSQNHCFIGNVVYKAFDYRHRQRQDAWRRTSDVYLSIGESLGLSNVKSVIDLPDFKLISYSFISGTHQPQVVAHLTQLFEKLQLLHANGLAHGDIRLSNLIFTDHPQTFIIDFDFSGEIGQRVYPSGYNREIGDGERHPNAQPDCLLLAEHDTFSALWICRHHGVLEGLDDSASMEDILVNLRQLPQSDQF